MSGDGQITTVVVGGTGSGEGTITSQNVVTPAGQPNITIRAVPTGLALLFATAYQFLNVFLSLLGAAGLGNKFIPFTDMKTLILGSASAAFIAAGLDLGKSLFVIVGKLKERYPLLGV
jgi:hypothetical protein